MLASVGRSLAADGPRLPAEGGLSRPLGLRLSGGREVPRWCGQDALAARASLRAHDEPILNGFRARKEMSAGTVEGLNGKPRPVTKRGPTGSGAIAVLKWRSTLRWRPTRTPGYPQVLPKRLFQQPRGRNSTPGPGRGHGRAAGGGLDPRPADPRRSLDRAEGWVRAAGEGVPQAGCEGRRMMGLVAPRPEFTIPGTNVQLDRNTDSPAAHLAGNGGAFRTGALHHSSE